MSVQWRRARKVCIHCPILQDTFTDMARGNLAALEQDPVAAKMLAVIRADNPLGDFDQYRGVFEVSLGLEGFTATARANPTAGVRGEHALSPTVHITTYIDSVADPVAVSAELAELVQMHPWETPVIEISEGSVQLPMR